MTREQKIAKARRLLDEGRTYEEVAKRVGVHMKTVRRWLIPGEAERDRQSAREWKARNREAMRAYDAAYDATHKGVCSSCGAETNRRTNGGVCMACREDENDRRARIAEAMWAEGASLKDIADRLGTSRNALCVEFHRWREKGYDLPYRYTTGKRAGHRFPEQVAA